MRVRSRLNEMAMATPAAVAIEGYYALLAMVMNTARTPLAEGRTPALTPFPR